ncbi:MAG: hypothetical protein ACI4S4_06650, partial [Candidatus Ornithospirochaeta sp.]
MMVNIRGSISRKLSKASHLVVALLLLFLLFSCSAEAPLTLCRVGLQTKDTSRSLQVRIIDPLLSYNIYYRAMYKGTGTSYGSMSSSDNYKRLGDDGILVSQGLWDIEVLFSSLDASENDGSDYVMKASARGIYINLNTTVITVSPESEDSTATGKGKLSIEEYTLENLGTSSTSVP